MPQCSCVSADSEGKKNNIDTNDAENALPELSARVKLFVWLFSFKHNPVKEAHGLKIFCFCE